MNFTHETIDDQWDLIKHRDGKSYGIRGEAAEVPTVGAVHVRLTDRDGVSTLHELDLTHSAFFPEQVVASAAVYLGEEGHADITDDHSVILVRVDGQNPDGSYILHDLEGNVVDAEYNPA